MMSTLIQLFKKAGWAPIAVVVLHGICGEIFGHEPYVDPVMHFLGGAAIAYFVIRAAPMAERPVGTLRELGLDLMAFGLASAAAVIWELGEWLSDGLLDTNVQRSAAAPLRDLAIGLLGAFLFLLGNRIIAKHRIRRTKA